MTHDYPDPDGLASAYALWHLAYRVIGIPARIAYRGTIGRDENREMVRLLRLPIHRLRLGDLKRYRSVALVDTQPGFNNNPFTAQRNVSIVIDQHDTADIPKADFVILDVLAGATSVLIASAILAHKIEIPRSVATALVYGILTDTSFLRRDERLKARKLYARLLPKCDVEILARIQNPSRRENYFRMLAGGLRGTTIHKQLIVSHLGRVDNPDFVSQMADFLLTCRGMRWSFCTGRIGRNLHVSIRSRRLSPAVVSLLRRVLHNIGRCGGHGHVAGGKLVIQTDREGREWASLERLVTGRLLSELRIRPPRHARPLTWSYPPTAQGYGL